MPNLIIVALGYLGIYGTVAMVAAYAITIAASVVAYKSLAKGLKMDGALMAVSPLQLTREAAPPHRVIYGETRASGPIAFVHTWGANANENMALVVVLAAHECESISESLWINEAPVSTSGGAATTAPYVGKYSQTHHLGADAQTADSGLVADTGGAWTTDHRLRGTAYTVPRLTYDSAVWVGGLPNLTWLVRGKRLYDPRDASTAWSANPALILRDYLTNTTYGLGFDAAEEIDDASFIAAANVCDEAVDLAAGGTELRYRCHGVFETSTEPRKVVEQVLGTMAGSLFYAGGKWRVLAGAWQTPAVTLTDDDLRDFAKIQTRDSLRDSCNRVKGTFTAPADLYNTRDFPAVTNATYLAQDVGFELWRDLDLSFVHSGAQAQRLAKIELERARQDITVSFPAKLTAFRIQTGDVVLYTSARYGFTAKPFVVEAWTLSIEGTDIGVDLTLRETDSSVWDWSEEETAIDPAPNTTLPNPFTVAPVTSLALTSGGALVTIAPDGTTVSLLSAAWTAPADAYARSGGGAVEIQAKLSASGTWGPSMMGAGGSTSYLINGLTPGLTYDVRVRAINTFGIASSWVTATAHLLAGDTTAPAAPSGVAIAAGGQTVADQLGLGNNVYASVTWTQSTAPDFLAAQVYYAFASGDPLATVAFIHNVGEATRSQVSLPGNHIYGGGLHASVRFRDLTGNWSAFTYAGNIVPSLVEALGTASRKNVPASGNAATTEAVLGNDTRLTDTRAPAAHTHGIADLTDLGNMALQDNNDVFVNGISIGAEGASDVRRVVARYPFSILWTFDGGNPTETVDLDISNRGFTDSTTKRAVFASVTDGAAFGNLICVHEASGSDNDTVCPIRCISLSGANIPASEHRISGEVIEWE